MEVTIEDDEAGFREVFIEANGTAWRFRELSGLEQEQLADLELSEYRAGLAGIALSMRDVKTGNPYFPDVRVGIEALLHRPAGELRQVLQHGTQLANRMADDDPEP